MENCTSSATSDDSGGGAGMVVIAIICVVCSSLTTTFGLFFQKIAQERLMVEDTDISDDKAVVKAFHRRTTFIWLAGFVNITLLSFALDLFSMATLGQAMVVPLLASLEVAENQWRHLSCCTNILTKSGTRPPRSSSPWGPCAPRCLALEGPSAG